MSHLDTKLPTGAGATVVSHDNLSPLPSAPANVATSPALVGSPRSSMSSSTHRSEEKNPFDTDIEMQPTQSSENFCARKSTQITRKSDCQVWPGKDHWKQKAKAAKAKRSCAWMAGMSPRNRWITKILIVLLLVGIAVGVGFGVSKPLGAPIWGSKDKNSS